MPTYQYEAMDHTGREVKDTIDASTQEEAQQLIRQKGFFVTKIAEQAKKAKKRASAKKGASGRRSRSRSAGSHQAALHVHPPALDLQDAGLPILRSLKILEGQCKPGVLKNSLRRHRRGHRERLDALGSLRQASQGVRPALLQHDQGRRGRRCSRSDPSASGRLQGEVAVAEAADQVGHGLPGGGDRVACVIVGFILYLHHSQVRGDLQRLRHPAAGDDDVLDRREPLR